MLKGLAKGLLGRLLSYAVFGLGFWLLFQGFLKSNIPVGILGGGLVLGGMYLMTVANRNSFIPPSDRDPASDKEDNPVDSLDRSDQGD